MSIILKLLTPLIFSVPSPQDCSLRKQKIVLREQSSFKIVNSTAKASDSVPSNDKQTDFAKRDVESQTTLTFPSVLPQEVEEVLKKFNIINDDGCENIAKQEDDNEENRSMMDVSTLRRKLFINRPDSPETNLSTYDCYNVNLSPPPRTPELAGKESSAREIGINCESDSFGDMFGEISPIEVLSPGFNNSVTDVSMTSDCHEKTPSRREACIRLKRKNLSESFCLMQNSEDFQDQIEDLLPETRSVCPIKSFGRFDSGFPAEEDSKFSSEYMQF